MRPIHLTDLDKVVRAVFDLDTAERRVKLDEIIRNANTDDRYRKRFNRPHPRYGTGRLGSTVTGERKSITFCNAHYRACLRDLLERLLAK